MASLAVDTNAEAQQLLEAEGNALWTNIRQIGTGGSGSVVFKAYDKYVEQDVALKVIKVEREADRQRLEREPKALEKIFASDLDDTNICKFYKWGYLANPTWLYIKMELADGGTLSERLATLQEPMSEREALQMALSILSALATVHEKKLVHRDIKPQNILLVDSAYKLADFGLAFEPTDTVPAAANTFQTMSLGGTPQYSSPEQLMEQTLAPQTDLWSLAVTMYQCLSGRLPFGEHPAMAIGNIMSRNPPPSLVDVSNGRVAPEVASIVAKAMAFDPNDRFLSATAMADAIRDALSDYDVFISYRRTHQEYGRKIKEELRRHGLKAFLDIDPEDGLTIGDFQAQLERVLEHTPTVFMLVTPAPSGPDQRAAGGIDRSSISSMGHIAEYLKRGWTDWCELEMRRSLELHKQIVPIFPPNVNIGAELGKIGHLDSVKQLQSLNGFAVDVNDVAPGIERIVQHLRKKNLDRSKMSSKLTLMTADLALKSDLETVRDEEEVNLLKEHRARKEMELLHEEDEKRRKGKLRSAKEEEMKQLKKESPELYAEMKSSFDTAVQTCSGNSDQNGYPPLHYAVIRDHVESARALILPSGEYDLTQMVKGKTALHYAAKCRETSEMISLLLSNNELRGNIDQRSKNGQTPLHLASYQNRHQNVRVLLRLGAKPNIKNNDGWTPLRMAIFMRSKECIALLRPVTTCLDVV